VRKRGEERRKSQTSNKNILGRGKDRLARKVRQEEQVRLERTGEGKSD
jgi:hypothetical protein